MLVAPEGSYLDLDSKFERENHDNAILIHFEDIE